MSAVFAMSAIASGVPPTAERLRQRSEPTLRAKSGRSGQEDDKKTSLLLKRSGSRTGRACLCCCVSSRIGVDACQDRRVGTESHAPRVAVSSDHCRIRPRARPVRTSLPCWLRQVKDASTKDRSIQRHRPQWLLILHARSKLKGPAPRARTKRAPPASPMSFQKWMNWAQRAVASLMIDQ
jgi:hypothetical protein